MNVNYVTVECESCYHVVTFRTGVAELLRTWCEIFCPVCGYSLGIQISGQRFELEKILHPVHITKEDKNVIEYIEIPILEEHELQSFGAHFKEAKCSLCATEKKSEVN